VFIPDNFLIKEEAATLFVRDILRLAMQLARCALIDAVLLFGCQRSRFWLIPTLAVSSRNYCMVRSSTCRAPPSPIGYLLESFRWASWSQSVGVTQLLRAR
jgi:hypothetical protein